MRSARKYILIPEYAPLYAMRECFGVEHGPLKEPTPTPVDVIGKLLLQSGREKVTIYEVIKEGKGFSKPVQLTKQNYRLSYEEIAGIRANDVPADVDKVTFPTPPADPVDPVVVETQDDEEGETEQSEPIEPCGEVVQNIVDNCADMLKDQVDAEIMKSTEPSETEETTDESTEAEVAEESETEAKASQNDPYAGMSKNQRKKARREEAVRKAAEDALKNVVH